jgi:hypothetical protein
MQKTQDCSKLKKQTMNREKYSIAVDSAVNCTRLSDRLWFSIMGPRASAAIVVYAIKPTACKWDLVPSIHSRAHSGPSAISGCIQNCSRVATSSDQRQIHDFDRSQTRESHCSTSPKFWIPACLLEPHRFHFLLACRMWKKVHLAVGKW